MLNPKETKKIEKLIKKGESEIVEFKSSLSEWRSALETLAAFSWNKGGKIIFGVSQTRKINGVEIGKGTIESLANSIKQNTDPKLYPSIKFFKIENKDIILVETEKISSEPVLAFGKAYKRIGKSTHQMSREEYKRVIRYSYEQEFDGQICEKATLKEIDWEFVKKFFIPKYEALTKSRLAGNHKNLLESLGAIKNNKPTNAGILLFGKEPQKFFMNSYIALARYKGKVVGAERLDHKEFLGNLFQQINNCNKYIEEHIAIMSQLHPGKIEREDIPEYPLFSIRELIVNAVAHRDYTEQKSKIIIKIFDDKVEYYNPGGLAKGINPQNITKKQFSRNPTIAKVLSKIRYIEEVGEGWDKIIAEHKEHPLKPKMPKISSDEYSITITLFSTKEKFEKKEEILVLNERQKKIIGFIEKNGRITTNLCAILLSISTDTALRELTKLKSLNLINAKGVGKATYYIIK